MKNLILILAIAFIAMFSSLKAEEEIIWRSTYRRIIDPNDNIDPGYIYNAIFTPDDKFLIVSCEFRTFLIESETGKYINDIPVSGVIRFSNDGKYIYTFDNKKFNYETMELVGEFKNKGEKPPRFTSMDVCEKAGIMVGVLQNADYNNWRKDIWVFDLQTMELVEQLGDTNEFYEQITMSHDGSFFNTNSYYVKKDVRIQHNYFWDMKLRKQLFNGFEKKLFIVQYSPDGKTIGCVRGGQVSLFDTEKFEKKWEMAQTKFESLNAITFSQNSKYFSTSGSGAENDVNDIHVWDVEVGKLSYRYSNGRKNNVAYTNLNYSNNGKLLLGYSTNGIGIFYSFYNTTKVDPIISNDTMLVSPNPVTSKVSLNITQPYNAKLFSQTGSEIDVASISYFDSSKYEIDVRSLQSGSYYLVISQSNISKLYKFIKE